MNLKDRIRAYRYAGVSAPAFTSVWDTTKTSTGSSTSTQVKLPLLSSGVYNFTVDWGDGSAIDTITTWNNAKVTHTYSSSGIYTVKITGVINGWKFNNTGDRLKLKEISKFGSLNINDERAFSQCPNLVITASDTLGTIGLISASYMFNGCSSLTTVPLFDLSSVTNAYGVFYSCSSLTTIPLLDTSNVTDMGFMFYGCSALTSLPLLDTSNVTNMKGTFRNSGLTSLPLLDLSSLTDGTDMLYQTTLSTTSYSDFLNHLNTLSLQSGVSFHGGNSKYNAGAATARANIISTYGWTITDGGAA